MNKCIIIPLSTFQISPQLVLSPVTIQSFWFSFHFSILPSMDRACFSSFWVALHPDTNVTPQKRLPSPTHPIHKCPSAPCFSRWLPLLPYPQLARSLSHCRPLTPELRAPGQRRPRRLRSEPHPQQPVRYHLLNE